MTEKVERIFEKYNVEVERVSNDFPFPDPNGYTLILTFQTERTGLRLRFTDGDDFHMFEQIDGAYSQFGTAEYEADRIIRENEITGKYSSEDREWIEKELRRRNKVMFLVHRDLALLVYHEMKNDNYAVLAMTILRWYHVHEA